MKITVTNNNQIGKVTFGKITRVGTIVANDIIDIGTTVFDKVNAAYLQANTAANSANARVLRAGDTMTGNLNVAATIISQNVLPASNVVFNLGSPSRRYKDLYLSGNSIYIGDMVLSSTGDELRANTFNAAVSVIVQGENLLVKTNNAYDQANSAYDAANTKLPLVGGTLTGDLVVTGNLVVSGNSTTLNTEVLVVEDADIVLLSNVTSTPVLNAGIIINRGSSSNTFLRWNEDTDRWGWSDNGTTFYTLDTSLNAYLQANNARGQANTARSQANTARDTANGAYVQANGAYAQANGAYAQANGAYAQANGAYGQANLAFAQANSAYDHANIVYAQANTARDTANDAYAQANAGYAQANTARDTANGAYAQANGAYAQANGAYAQANGAYAQANLAFAQANGAYAQANGAYGQANLAFAQANGAYAHANIVYAQANGAYAHANIVYAQANVARTTANDAYNQANSNYQPATTRLNVTNSGVSSYRFDQYGAAVDNPTIYVRAGESLAFSLNNAGHPFMIRQTSGGSNYDTGLTHVDANGAVTTGSSAQAKTSGTLYWKVPYELQGNTYVYQCQIHSAMVGNIVIEPPMVIAYAQANVARTTANDAYAQANTARDTGNNAYAQANTARDTANDAYLQANTARTTANDAYAQANAGYAQANTARTTANDSYAQANTARDTANDAYAQANTARTTANDAYGQANAGYSQANAAYGQANAAYGQANLKLNLTGGTINGDLTVSGNLFLSQNTTLINVSTYQVDDPLIYLASNNQISDTVDIGFMGGKNTSGIYSHTGLVRHAGDQKYYLFDGLADEAHQNNVINVSALYLATLKANIEANSILLVGNAVSTQANLTLAHNQANTARDTANDSYAQANVGRTTANDAYAQANTARTTANDAYSQANAGYAQANTARTTANDAYSQANTARTTANDAYSQANTARTTANDAYSQANSSFDQANAAYAQANTARATANDSYAQANSGYAQANTARDTANNSYTQANVARTTANDAYSQANAAYNDSNTRVLRAGDTMTGNLNVAALITTQNVLPNLNVTYDIGSNDKRYNKVYGNTIWVGDAELTSNGPTIKVSGVEIQGSNVIVDISGAFNQANAARAQANTARDTANGAYAQANGAYGQANGAYAQANGAYTQANGAYGQANLAFAQANGAYAHANIVYAQANTARDTANDAYAQANSARSTANASYGQANAAYNQANNAYAEANLKLNLTGGTINGSLNISGNLILTGNATLINTTSYIVSDPLIFLASNNNIGDIVDIGFVGAKNTGSGVTHTGLARDAGDKIWYLFDNLADSGHENNVVDFANTTLATLRANIEANSLTLVGNVVATQANLTLAHNQANTARGTANDAYAQANVGRTTANDAYGQANTARTTANDAYAVANTANTNAINAYAQANVARTTANDAYGEANTAHNKANGAYSQANGAYAQANGAYAQANGAYAHANGAYAQANLAFAQANGAYAHANIVYAQANAAYNEANLKLNLTGGTINGSLNVSGNLTITGNTKYVNVETYSVTDPLIYLAANNEISDLVDIGFMGGHNTGGVYQHSGLARDAGDGTWYLFTGLEEEGHENNVVDFANTSLATLRANISANSILLVGNVVATQANLTLAHNQANTARDTANASYTQANTNYLPAVTRLDVTNNGASAYRFDQYGAAVDNPGIYVRAGETIAFNLNNAGHPFAIRVSSGGSNYDTGLTHVDSSGIVSTGSSAQGKVAGTLYWKVPYELQGNTYVYQCTIHGGMVGNIVIEPPSVVAYAQANAAYGRANSAYAQANAAYGQANASYVQANAAYAKANAPITVKEIYASNSTVVNTYTNINTLQFDSDSGMAVVNAAANTVTIQLNSTFKNWLMNGNTGLVATGLDTVNFIGNGITIEANNNASPKTITFTSSGGGGGGGSALTIKDEGTSLNTAVTSIDFVGGGVTATASGSNVTVTIPTGLSDTIVKTTSFTANNAAANLTYTLPIAPISSAYLFVIKNGIVLLPNTDYSISNTTLTVIESGAANDVIEVRYFDQINVYESANTLIEVTSNTVAAQTNTFTLANVTAINRLAITKNGLQLTPNLHYSINTSSNTVTLNTVAEIGDTLTFTNFRNVNDIAGGGAGLTQYTYNTSTSSIETVDEWSKSTYRSAKYQMQVESGSGYQAVDIMVIHDGVDTNTIQYGSTVFGSNVGIFTSDISGSNVRLRFTAVDPTSYLTYFRTILANRASESLPTDLMSGSDSYDLLVTLSFHPTDLN